MAKVIISASLEEEVNRTFKKESVEVLEAMRELGNNPHKGTALGQVSGIQIKEIRYDVYRFYFIVDGYKLRVFNSKELNDLLIRFVRMSGKKDQQKTIDEIKSILKKVGEEGFDEKV